MDISKEDFFLHALKANISKEKADVLWKALQNIHSASQETTPFKLLYYFGSLITISAIILFMGLNWELLGGGGIFLIASLYSILLTWFGSVLWKNKTLRTPASLLITLAICMVPLAIYGLEVYLQVWPTDYPGEYADFYSRVKGSWIFMEIGTLLAGFLALRFFNSSPITIPIFVAGWFLVMDGVHFLRGESQYTYPLITWVSLYYGLGLMIAGYFLDRYGKDKYAFWSYFFGTLAFWSSLCDLAWNHSENEWILLIYLLINFILLSLSILLQRKILCIVGAIGIFAYLSHVAYRIFENSIWFPIVLSLIGILLIYCGVLYQKHRVKLQNWMFNQIPERLRDHFSFKP
ncbi:hypothetical protein [Parachlamydia acanthamoebae]|jgi:hypothetical protein|uniref:hypothetical protein n=1 Tax=Parachlamydia acanthamoebae TaxID=83552 RepID=UPI0001C1782A|nr:hypothetical protein [Parachlamydia acanthamoebae]EFB42508.1 hypothetical protein pah_c005o042 [Parachlamydia acanthamoebae str. Hall's coccus]